MTSRDAGEHPALPANVCGNSAVAFAKGGYIAEVERLQAECRRLEAESDELRADRHAALAATAAVRETWTRVARHNRTRAQEAEADRDRARGVAVQLEQQVAAALALHWERVGNGDCAECTGIYPCLTVAALHGDLP